MGQRRYTSMGLRIGFIQQVFWFLLLASATASAQSLGVKTNLFWDATATPNLGVEGRLGMHLTAGVSANYAPWKITSEKYWKHWLVQPELRYWTKETFAGHYLGVQCLGGVYNVSDLKVLGAGGSRYEGSLIGGGLTYGYVWKLSPRWRLETGLGIGYLRMNYDKYACGYCGEPLDHGSTNYFGPTSLSVSLIFMTGR